MRRRQLDVTASTTFDFVDARAEGADWTDETVAVLDVDAPADGPATVTVAVELEPGDLEHVDRHVDRVGLAPDEARTLAEELLSAADDAEAGGRDPGRRG